MIDRQDIFDFSRELGLRPEIVEKDYVLGWVLSGIFAHPSFRQTWIFKGEKFAPGEAVPAEILQL